ncbi:MAG: hypothetical protein JWL97_2975 [Gemmatimonadales bacterium]|nr:hypothetical protein [Gemmatimonadales bacterium]
MTAKVDICNLALSHLANSSEIADLDAEQSKEAQACRRFFDEIRDEVLRDFPWPFAMTQGALALVASNPTIEWGYSYRLPAGCLNFRRILSGVRNDSRKSRIVYRLGQDAAGDLIFTDQPSAQAEWTAQITNTERFRPDFVLALSYLLAFRIGPRVAGDKVKVVADAQQNYYLQISKAKANALNEEQLDDSPDSEFVSARE